MSTSPSTPSWLAIQVKRSGIADFWQWWTAELRSAIGPFLAKWTSDEATVVEAIVGGEGIVFPGKTIQRIDAMLEAAARRSAIETVLRERGREVQVLVDASRLLIKRVRYPQATEENLREVVGYDMDRQTPFTAGQVVFDARVVGRDTVRGTLEVELAVMTRSALQDLIAPLKEAGCVVHGIGLADDRGVPRFEFLPAAEKPARRLSRMQRIHIGMAAGAMLLILLAVAIPIFKKRAAAVELNPVVAKAENEADVTRRVESEYQRFAQQYNFLTAKKHVQVPVLEIVEELTRVSPDTTWLTSLEIKTSPKAREVTLQGEAASASKMIEVLEQSALLQNASPRSQITRGAQPNTERFNIVTEVKPRAQPAPRALAQADAPVSAPPPAAMPPPAAVAAPPSPSAAKANASPAPVPPPTAKPTPPVSAPAPTSNPVAPPAVAKPPVAMVPPPGAPAGSVPVSGKAGTQ